jgi:pimeloyl-ACP methyl ester carboxylesterase
VEAVVDGATLFYEQTGAGPDIVWLAAGDHPGSNWRRFQTPAFEPGFRNTTYDARGVGATAADDAPPWPIETHARDCAALIEAVCAPPVFLVGLSMGSLIATELACTRRDLVRAALVMGTCVRKTGFIREWEEAEIALHRDGAGLPGDFATAHYAMLYYPAEVLGDDELWARIRPLVAQDFAARDGRMLAAQVAGVPGLRLERSAAAVRGPGPRDRVLPRRPDAAGARARGRRARAARALPPARGPRARVGVRPPPRRRQRVPARDHRGRVGLTRRTVPASTSATAKPSRSKKPAAAVARASCSTMIAGASAIAR